MKTLILLASCLLLMSGCVTQKKSLYSWDKYDAVAYQYVKNNTDADAEALAQTLQRMIDNPGGERKIPPPGICADYGYLLVKQDKIEEGLKYLKMEVALYPESAILVERIIKQLEQ